ncbi:unnamed protein product [Cyprideis torosa]|uniref:DNA repair protein RecO n=1 Tax=Cyprideis torosa TaxID=163714 RepID=A0A7R8ZTF3_9CRUS|nr:unnamed protein product [Cyprideis torosa]CAG0903891.1 unnamed protein product [Cyprideis torosa]
MEQWTNQGIVLSARSHGEGGAVVSLLTENNGRHAGYVHGAMSSKKRGFLQAGSQVKAQWSARVSDSLGTYTLEPEAGLPDGVLDSSLKLAALLSACSLCDAALPEREGHSGLYHGFLALMDMLSNDDLGDQWGAAYVMWEISLLRELGFHLELDKCAGGGDSETLCYASPKTGRAVSKAQAAPYKEKLLLLPNFLRPHVMREEGVEVQEDILTGLKMTGYFLEHWAFIHHAKGVPEPRVMFEERFGRSVVNIIKERV